MFLRFARFLPRLRKVSAGGRAPVRRWRRWIGRGVLALVLLAALGLGGLWLALRLVPFDPNSIVPAETSSIVVDRKWRPLRAYLSRDERWRLPARLENLSPWVIKATLAVEDKRFYHHSGIDPVAVVRAAFSNLRRGRTVSGASTITMQSAGLADEPRRTWRLKLRQAFRALQLERAWTKKQILEFYLTHAPYGGNICGIEAASRRYFNKPARELSLSEATLLAGLPQSPSRLRPDRHMEAALQRRAHVLRRMLENGDITRADYERVLPQRPAVGQFDAPVEAPHFCDYVHARHPLAPVLRTTLDLDIQHMAEQLLREKVRALAPRGVTNGAVVVLENATGHVLAMVGSVDYTAEADSGQVNGATSPRSPGSTLKPFLYALAFERRLMAPATILADVPQPFADYRPENFDRTFLGLVSAEKALAWSLNIPAIDVLRRVGVGETLHLLRKAGLETLRGPAEQYGLSLAIGTCQTRLVDVANAYAMLARGGIWRPWRAWESRATSGTLPGAGETRLLSRGAAWMVNRALSDPALRPPEGIDPGLAGMEGVAWKTGTSSGFRDAWTFAYDSRYTVGVWVGNMDGRPSRALAGAEAAAPVALGLMQRLRMGGGTDQGDAWLRTPPPEIGSAVVCPSTGLPPGDDCPSTRSVTALQGGEGVPALLDVCQVHRRLPVDAATSTVLCTRCLSGRARTEQVYTLWPTDTAAWLASQGQADADVPPHFAGCRTLSPFAPPKVVSPRPGDRYVVTAGRPAAFQKLALEASAAPVGARLYWFLDGSLVQVTEAGGSPAFTELKPGRHTIRCVDQYGRADTVTFVVEEE